jgi:hypothetical protein
MFGTASFSTKPAPFMTDFHDPHLQIRDATHDSSGSISTSPVLSHVVLNGEYSDFSQAWYENVGLSLLVRLFREGRPV